MNKIVKGILPNFFLFKTSSDLIRIGKDNDGGYLLSQSDLEKTDVLISFGISDDWSFEEEFLIKKKVEIFSYDASINKKFFLKQIIQSLNRIDNYKILFHWIKTLYKYTKFFSKKKVHHFEKYVGLDTDNYSHCTFLETLNKTNSENIFFKIDIEGSEYRFLEDLIKSQERICGLVIEFHDCDINLDKIKYFLKNFKLKLIHVHANNYSPVNSQNGLPLVLELTFSKYSEKFNSYCLPHPKDMPNDKNKPEIELMIDI